MHHLPRVRVELPEAPGGPASLFPARRGPRPLSDHCAGHRLGARPCYPGLMTLVLRRLGHGDFSFSKPRATLSPPQLAPHPAAQWFCLTRVGLAVALGESVLERSEPRPGGHILTGAWWTVLRLFGAVSGGRERNPEVSAGFRSSRGTRGIPGAKESPELPG